MSKTAAINMRVEPAQHDLVTRAAAMLHTDRSSFIMNVACREAENVLLNQRLFSLNEDDFTALQAVLDAPVEENSRLKKLLTEASPWEK